MSQQFSDSIFKAYDIRGLVEGELSVELAYRVARAFVHVLRSENVSFEGKKLVVGYDMRPTSVDFKDAVIRGFQDEGVDVVDIGMCSTPLFNFTCAHFDEYVGGIMVTASHNPAQYNGFKLTRADGLPVGKGTGMETIRALCQASDFIDAPRKGSVVLRDTKEEYFAKIFSLVDVSAIKPLTVVLDGGNGMGNVTFEPLLKKIPQLTVHTMYMEPDGTFPNHEANPLKLETLHDLQQKVTEVHANFGFALDGDADRVGVVDEQGNIVDASFVGTLLGQEALKNHPGMLMLYDLRSSQIGPEVWQSQGAQTQMCMVGHALIKNMMKQTGAGFASELSLHIFYGDLYNIESSDLCFLYFLKILSQNTHPLSEMVAPLKKYFHSGEINFETEKKDDIMQAVESEFAQSEVEISHLDGLWMKFDWGFLSLRKSNTEPVLRLNVEASTKEKMDEVVQHVQKFL